MLAMIKATETFQKRLQTRLSASFQRNNPDLLYKTLETEIKTVLKPTWDIIQQSDGQSHDDDDTDDLQWQPLAAAFRDCLLQTVEFFLQSAKSDNQSVRPEMVWAIVDCQRNFTGILSNLNSIYNDSDNAKPAFTSKTSQNPGRLLESLSRSASSFSSDRAHIKLTQKQLLPYWMPWPVLAMECPYRSVKTEILVKMITSVLMNYHYANENRLLADFLLTELNSRADYTLDQHTELCLCMQRNDGVIKWDDDDEDKNRQQQRREYKHYSKRLFDVKRFPWSTCFSTPTEQRKLVRAHLHEFYLWSNESDHPLTRCFNSLDDSQRAELLLQFVEECRDVIPHNPQYGSAASTIETDQHVGDISQVTANNAKQLFSILIDKATSNTTSRSTTHDHINRYFLEYAPSMTATLLNRLGAVPELGLRIVSYFANTVRQLVYDVDESWRTSPRTLICLLSEITYPTIKEDIMLSLASLRNSDDTLISFRKRFHPEVVAVLFSHYGERLQQIFSEKLKSKAQEQERETFKIPLFEACKQMSATALYTLISEGHKRLLQELVKLPEVVAQIQGDQELTWHCLYRNIDTDFSCQLLSGMQLSSVAISLILQQHQEPGKFQHALLLQLDTCFNKINIKKSMKADDTEIVIAQQQRLVALLEIFKNEPKIVDILLHRYAAAIKALPAVSIVDLAVKVECPSQLVEDIVIPSLLMACDVPAVKDDIKELIPADAVTQSIKRLILKSPCSMFLFKAIYFNKKLKCHVDFETLKITLANILDCSTYSQPSKTSSRSHFSSITSSSSTDDSDVALKCQLLADRDFMIRYTHTNLCAIAADEKITNLTMLKCIVHLLLNIAYENHLRYVADETPDPTIDELEALLNDHTPRAILLRNLCLQCVFEEKSKTILFSSLLLKPSDITRAQYYQTIAFSNFTRTQLALFGKDVPLTLLPIVLEIFSHDDASFLAKQLLSLFLAHPSDISELIVSKVDAFIMNQSICVKIDEVLLSNNEAQAAKLKRLRSQLIVNEIMKNKRLDSVKNYTDAKLSLLDYLGQLSVIRQRKPAETIADPHELLLVTLIVEQAPLKPLELVNWLSAYPHLSAEMISKLWPIGMTDEFIDKLILKLIKTHGTNVQQYDALFKILLSHYTYAKNTTRVDCLDNFIQRLNENDAYELEDKECLRLFIFHATWLTQGAQTVLTRVDNKKALYYLHFALDDALINYFSQRAFLYTLPFDYSKSPRYVYISEDNCYLDNAWYEARVSRENVLHKAQQRAIFEDSALLLGESTFHAVYPDGNVKAVLNEKDIVALKLFNPKISLDFTR